MKLKKRIGVLICCLAIIGMFSFIKLPVEAAACTHPAFLVGQDVVKESFANADGHFEVRGTGYQCRICQYTYWENLYTVKISNHHYRQLGIDAYGNPYYSDYCFVCGRHK